MTESTLQDHLNALTYELKAAAQKFTNATDKSFEVDFRFAESSVLGDPERKFFCSGVKASVNMTSTR